MAGVAICQPFVPMRARPPIVVLLIAAALISGCGGADPKSEAPGEAAEQKALRGSPPPLAAIHDQRNELLGGGSSAFKQRLAALRGFPVVVNKWASWCGPCRAEFPYFQKLSVERGKKIAFLGVNSNDEDAGAKRFLDQYPVSYPSYKDANLDVAAVFKAVAAFPTTAFYDSKGKLAFLHQGGYANEAQLQKDIDRYAR